MRTLFIVFLVLAPYLCKAQIFIQKDKSYILKACYYRNFKLESTTDTTLTYTTPTKDCYIYRFNSKGICYAQTLITTSDYANGSIRFMNEHYVKLDNNIWKDYSTNIIYSTGLSKDNAFFCVFMMYEDEI